MLQRLITLSIGAFAVICLASCAAPLALVAANDSPDVSQSPDTPYGVLRTAPVNFGAYPGFTSEPMPRAADSAPPGAVPGSKPAAASLPAPQAVPVAASSGWRHYPLPSKKPTLYAYELTDGRHTMKAKSASSASMLRQAARREAAALGKVHFSWKVPRLIPGADLALRETHDSPVRVVLTFEGDRTGFSMKNAMLSELSLALTGEALPYATLMYVWCNQCAPGSVLTNPRTDRIREIVMESGPANLGRWMDYQRDVRADFQSAFGEAPGALLDVGIMTDTDNTKQEAVAWYGPISMSAPK